MITKVVDEIPENCMRRDDLIKKLSECGFLSSNIILGRAGSKYYMLKHAGSDGKYIWADLSNSRLSLRPIAMDIQQIKYDITSKIMLHEILVLSDIKDLVEVLTDAVGDKHEN